MYKPPLADTVRTLTPGRGEEWVPLAIGEDERATMAAAWRRLAELGVPLPPDPLRRDVRAAGLADEHIRMEFVYPGSGVERCYLWIDVRSSALQAALGMATPDPGPLA